MSMSTATGASGPHAAAWGRAAPQTGFLCLLWVQGLYYFVTGLWPLVSIDTFLMITGPKTDHLQSPNPTSIDHWLVMTAGVLITAIGASLLVAAWRRSASAESAVLALAAALGLTTIDVLYVTRQVILPIYLADAAVEVVLILAWCVVLLRGQVGAAR